MGNDTKVEFILGSALDASYSSTSNKITVTVTDGAKISDIAAKIQDKLSSTFNVSNVANGDYKFSIADLGTQTGTFASGTNNTVGAKFQIKAKDGKDADGAIINATTIEYLSGSANAVSFDKTSNKLTITVAAGATIADITSKINASTDFEVVSGSTTNGTAIIDLTGASNTRKLTTVTKGTEYDGAITVRSKENSDTFDAKIKFVTSSGNAIDEVTARIATNGDLEIVTNAAGVVTLQSITDAINKLDDYTATLDDDGSTGDAAYNVAADTAPTIADLTGGTDGGGLDSDVTFELTGFRGSQEVRLKKGASLANIVSAVNSSSDTTGVEAFNDGGKLALRSISYGSKALVSINVTSGSSSSFVTGLSATRTNGTNAVATINGFAATSDGNNISINTSSLDLSLTLKAGSTSRSHSTSPVVEHYSNLVATSSAASKLDLVLVRSRLRVSVGCPDDCPNCRKARVRA